MDALTNCCSDRNKTCNAELASQQVDCNDNLDQVGPNVMGGAPSRVDPLNVGTHQSQGCARVSSSDADICGLVKQYRDELTACHGDGAVREVLILATRHLLHEALVRCTCSVRDERTARPMKTRNHAPIRPYPWFVSSESLLFPAHSRVAEMRNGWQKVKPMKHKRGKMMDRIGHFKVLRTVSIRAWLPLLDAMRLSVSYKPHVVYGAGRMTDL
jgi:hypothetical protein